MKELKGKKVLFLITKSNFGGAQRYVYDQTSYLAEKGVNLKVAFGDRGKLADKLESRSIPTISIPYLGRDVSLIKDVKAFFSIRRLIKNEAPDLLHLNSSKAAVMGAAAALLCNLERFLARLFLGKKVREGKVKVLFTVHGWAFNESRGFVSRIILKIIYWFIILLSDVVICVSKRAREQIRNFPFTKSKMYVVHNAITPKEVKSKQEARKVLAEMAPALEESLGKEGGDIWIGTISELHPIKGLSVAVEAISILKEEYPEIRYIIMGEEGAERGKIEHKIKEDGLEKNVFILGYVEGAPSFLSAFDIFTLSSFSEGLSYAVLEAGYAGLPVVASDVGGIPEIITNEVNGELVTPGDSQALADALRELIENPDKRESLSKNLKGRIDRYFNLDKMTNKIINIYSDLLEDQ